ncbi:LOG family protein [Flindersiella endophytica]
MFCGSTPGTDERYMKAATELAEVLAQSGMGIVYGGGNVGMMGAVADAGLAAGAEVIGVIPRILVDRELAHPGLTDLRLVADMHERKATMAALADAYIAMPGGIGTLEELFEIWTWGKLGIHSKRIGLLDVGGFYQPLLAFIDQVVEAGFLPPADRDALCVAATPRDLVDQLMAKERS